MAEPTRAEQERDAVAAAAEADYQRHGDEIEGFEKVIGRLVDDAAGQQDTIEHLKITVWYLRRKADLLESFVGPKDAGLMQRRLVELYQEYIDAMQRRLPELYQRLSEEAAKQAAEVSDR